MFSTTEFNHHVVNDLAWVIASPPLISHTQTGNDFDWMTFGWCQQQYQTVQKQLSHLDRGPKLLQQYLVQQRDKRLGNYFESLVAYWLNMENQFDILKHNLPVRENKKTQGEFDFIIQDRLNDKTIHLEVAVKFYLGLGDLTQYENWFGPGLIDRLDIKYDKLTQQQIRLSHSSQGQSVLSSNLIHIDERWILLKGRLFYPHYPVQLSETAKDISEDHLTGWWMTRSEFESLFKQQQKQWLILTKSYWLSSLNHVDHYFMATDLSSCQEIMRQLRRQPSSYPLCVAEIENNAEVSRGFIVPDQWPGEAIASLSR